MEEDPVPQDVETMYTRGLEYLVRTRTDRGVWVDPQGTQPGVIGLVVLAMLAHGDDPNNGPYATQIKSGLEYILSSANAANGYIGSSMYNHGFATLALAEAYGAVDDPRLGPALKKAVDLILSVQSQNQRGAWRYSPQSTDADTTVSGAQLVALMAARNAGLAVPEEAVDKALRFYLECQLPDGSVGYTGADSGGAARTAISALVFALAKQKESRGFKGAVRYLKDAGGERDSYFFYYLYYASQAYFHSDQESWKDFNSANIKRLKSAQNSDGSWSGSEGTLFATSAALMSLAINYRYLPIYER